MEKIWMDTEELRNLEGLRDLKRVNYADGRLTFDCLELVSRGSVCHCRKEKRLTHSKGGTMGLVTVLTGRTAVVCHGCDLFRTEDPATILVK